MSEDPVQTRGSVFERPGRSLRVEELLLDGPHRGEVLVRMVASGVCHSDLHVVDGEWERPANVVLGHEGAAIVEALGPDVPSEGPREGELVVLAWTAPCSLRELPSLPSERAVAVHRTPRQRSSAPGGGRSAAPGGRHAHRRLLGDRHVRGAPGRGASGRNPDRPAHAPGAGGPHRLRGHDRIRRGGEHRARWRRGDRGRHRRRRGWPVGRHGRALRRCRDDRRHRHQPGQARAGTPRRRDTCGADIRGGRSRRIDRWGCRSRPRGDRADRDGRARDRARPAGRDRDAGRHDAQGRRASIDVYRFVEDGKQLRGSNYGSATPAVDFPRIAALYADGRLPLDLLVTERIGLDLIGSRTRAVPAEVQAKLRAIGPQWTAGRAVRWGPAPGSAGECAAVGLSRLRS